MYSKTMFLTVLLVAVATVNGVAIAKDKEVVQPNPNNGFAVQSGYEGYLVSPSSKQSSSWLAPSKIAILKSLLLPTAGLLIAYGIKIATVVAHALLAVFLGFAASSAVCSLTPLCTMSMPGLGFLKGQSVKEQVAKLARNYMTPENMEVASRFVQSALEKYSLAPRREAEQPAEPQPDEAENETS